MIKFRRKIIEIELFPGSKSRRLKKGEKRLDFGQKEGLFRGLFWTRKGPKIDPKTLKNDDFPKKGGGSKGAFRPTFKA